MTIFSLIFIVFMISICIYSIFCFTYCRKFFFKRKFHSLFIGVGTGVNISLFLFARQTGLSNIAFGLAVFSFWLFLQFIYRIKASDALLCSIFFILLLLIFKGLGYSLISIAISDTPYLLADNQIEYDSIVTIAATGPILFIYLLYKTFAPAEKVKLLLSNQGQRRFMIIFEFTLFLYLMIIDNGRRLLLDPSWFNIIYITSFLLALFFLVFIIKNAITVSYLLESKMRALFLEEQLDRQLQHYRSYQKHTESFRVFKHDYKNMMASVKVLIAEKDFDRANLLLNKMQDIMSSNVRLNKDYSNNLLLDAILYDAANLCEEYSIKFSASVYMDTHVEMDDLDLVRVFSNLIDNAIEAASNVTNISDRFIRISGLPHQNTWILVVFENSYGGDLKSDDGKILRTSKKNSELHGLGTKIIADIMEKNGGLLELDTHSIPHVFKTTLAFPCSLPPSKEII